MREFRHTSAGHLRSITPSLLKFFGKWRAPGERQVSASVADSRLGRVKLSGLYASIPQADTLAIIVHGHGGNAAKPYCHTAARAARAAGFSSLRVSLRGADLTGEDIYHGGLTNDLAAFAALPEFARYRNLVLFGFSMGGHLVARAAIEAVDPRIAAAIAISPPLDIAAAVDALDSPRRFLYRRYILRGLHKIYAAVDARGRAPLPLRSVRRATTFREWDELTVAPRFGFRGAGDYYRSITLRHRLCDARIPIFILASNHDPVIPPETTRAALAGASRCVTARYVDGGGHLYFPANNSLAEECFGWAKRLAA